MGSDAGQLTAGLDVEQVAAVTSDSPVLRVVAGAGSGKTRVLTRRVAYRSATASAEAGRCLVVTFTRSAAGELAGRLQRLGAGAATVGTLHAVAWSLVAQRLRDRGSGLPALADRDSLIRRFGLGGQEISLEIGWASARMLSPEQYVDAAVDQGRATRPEAAAVADAMLRYRQEKGRRGLFDFDDVLVSTMEAFEQDASFAGAQRWRYRHLFVDELQDLTPLQFAVIRAWAGEDPDITAVGDPRQAIYSWNGSDPGLVEHFLAAFPGAVSVTLQRNYRCSPAIVAAAHSIDAAATPSTSVTRAGPDGPVPQIHAVERAGPDGPVPQIHAVETEESEGALVSRLLRRAAARGIPPTRCAVLARTNARADSLREGLAALGLEPAVTTFHRAKGLEWDLVVIAGMEEGTVPVAAAVGRPEAMAEEERLLYVAMTRAARELHLTRVDRRGGPSPYLTGIASCCARLEAERAPAPAAEGLAKMRAALSAGR